MKFKYLLTLIALGITSTSNAADLLSTKVTKIETYTNGTVAFYVDKTLVNPGSCSSPSKYLVEPGASGVNSVLSTLLSAKIASSEIDVRVSASCNSNYPVATRVTIK